MAIKLTGLEETKTLNDNDLFYTVIDSGGAIPLSRGMTKANVKTSLGISTSGSSSRIISGGMVWVSGLTYESIGLIYEINGAQFQIADNTQVTLDVAPSTPTFQRIDIIYGDDNGVIAVEKGTESATPIAPTIDAAFQIQLTFAFLDTDATEPTGVAIRDAYLEDVGQPTEFDATESTGGLRISLADTSAPITGTKSIKTVAPLVYGDSITLTHATPTLLADFAYLKIKIKNLANWGNDYITIGLYDGLDLVARHTLSSVNYPTFDTINVQDLTIWKYDWTITPNQTQFDTIVFFNSVRSPSSEILYILDDIKVGEDANTSQATNITGLDVSLDTANFDNNLDNTITDVQKLADAVDDLSTGGLQDLASVTGVGNTTPDDINVKSITIKDSTSGKFELTGRDAVTFAVPTFRSTTADEVTAFDVMPNGSPSEIGDNGLAWMDVTDKDAKAGQPDDIRAARVGVRSVCVEFGTRMFNQNLQVLLPIWLTIDGAASIILNTDFTVDFDKYGLGNFEAVDLSKTASDYIARFATDGTIIEEVLKQPVATTGTVIDLSNTNGTYYNMSSANSATSYTKTGEVLGGFAVIRINALTEPTITGGTKIAGSTFAVSTDMHLFVQYFGATVQYFFAEI